MSLEEKFEEKQLTVIVPGIDNIMLVDSSVSAKLILYQTDNLIDTYNKKIFVCDNKDVYILDIIAYVDRRVEFGAKFLELE